jgi:Bacterial archaeo-eukaryotic release factor family 10
MDFKSRLRELAKVPPTVTPVVSVYLNTRWADEQQRERVRIFLKNELRKARESTAAALTDLEWIELEGKSLIEQVIFPEADGVVLFACESARLRDVLPVRAPFEDTFVVDDTPFLRPLAALLDEAPPALVVFVDGTSARLIPLNATGTGEEVRLATEVEGRHSTGGWAALAQSRYQRHIAEHREEHLDAVAAALADLTARYGATQIVLAGEPRVVAVFRGRLPAAMAERIVGSVSGARYEASGAILRRAAELLAHADELQGDDAVDSALTEAAKGGQAVAGLEPTIEAVNRRAVRHLYLLKAFSAPGRVCVECEALQRESDATCRFCGQQTRAIELGEAMVDRVLATGGEVTMPERHGALAESEGLAALLRYVP